MKIQLTIELDLPEETREWSDAEIRQNVFDDYINYATTRHLSDALKWMIDKSPNAQLISDHHRLWGEICAVASFDLKRLD